MDRRRNVPPSALAGVAALTVVLVGAVLPNASAAPTQPAQLTQTTQTTQKQTTQTQPTQTTPAAQPAAASAWSGSPTQKWVKVEHDCAAPAQGHLSCYAIHVVPVRAGTIGAQRVEVPTYAKGPAGGYAPASLASAYKFDPRVGGTGQTVAIVDAYDDPYVRANLNSFNRHYGIAVETATSFRKVDQLGKTVTATHHPAYSRSWAGEIALDVQAVRAVCRKCKILLVEAASDSGTDLGAAANMAVKLGATEVSNSYGGPENVEGGITFAAAFNHPGVVVTASTGDAGWYDWDNLNYGDTSSNAPSMPAALPTVVAVGGTKLTLTTTGARSSETVWNGDGPQDSSDASGASGGGCSAKFTAPSWQRAAANYARTGCGTHRQTGDVAALADPYTGFDVYDTYGGSGWVTVGGTSLSSPVVAAMWALAGGSGGVRYPARSVYENVKYNTGRVHDVVSGGNGFCGGDTVAHCQSVVRAGTGGANSNPNTLGYGKIDCSFAATGTATIANNTQCNAAKGYDGPSGVGSPLSPRLFRSSKLTVTVKAAPARAGWRSTFTATVKEPLAAAKATKFAWAWGTGLTASTTTAAAGHTYAKAGTYTARVTVTDSLARTATASVKVVVAR